MTYRLTTPAEHDVRDIIRNTVKTFGPLQAFAYGRILERGMELVSEEPGRPGSFDRSEIAAGVRMLHLEIAAGRRGGAAHCLYYMEGRLADGAFGTIILRVLHERMEPRHRIVRALREAEKGSAGPES